MDDLRHQPSDEPAQQEPRARRAKFMSVASHDIRGAVANVRSYASLLLSGRTPLDDKTRRGLEVILRNADRALGLLQDFFDSCKHELGALPLDLEAQDVRPLLVQAVEQARQQLADRAVSLDVDLPSPLPQLEVDGPRFLHATRAFLEHAVWRVQDGGAVLFEARIHPHALEVLVHDTGMPPPNEELALQFDREFRALKDRKLEPGFRLCVARDEIEAHRGQVSVQANGGMTTFSFWLPSLPAHH